MGHQNKVRTLEISLGEISEIDDCLDESHDEVEEYMKIVCLNSRTVKEDADNNRIVDIPIRGRKEGKGKDRARGTRIEREGPGLMRINRIFRIEGDAPKLL